MQYYPVVGEWDRQGNGNRWIEWSSQDSSEQGDPITGWFRVKGRQLSMFSSDTDGKPEQKFAAGRIEQFRLFRQEPDGLWGTAPGANATVDVWGQRIDKLATLAITNQSIYDSLFG